MFWGSNFTFTFANVIKCWQCNSRFQSFSVQLKFHFHMAGTGQFHMHQVVNVRPLCKSQSTILQTQLTKRMFDQRVREWHHTKRKLHNLAKRGKMNSTNHVFAPRRAVFRSNWAIIRNIEQLFGRRNNCDDCVASSHTWWLLVMDQWDANKVSLWMQLES